MLEATFDRARLTWDNFNERERRLLSLMMAIFSVAMFSLVVYLVQRENAELEEESAKLRTALSMISAQRGRFEKIASDRKDAEARYKLTAPPLGSLLEAKAKDQAITVREVNEEPEKVSGNFKRRGARATLPGVALTPVMKLMAEISRSEFPVAIDYLQIEHYAAGQDNYTVQLGLVAYDKQGAKSKSDAASEDSDESE
jgi:type II secretory pathway component PulM